MSTTKEERFAALSKGPVCQTWKGCIERTKQLSLGDLMFLQGYLHCGTEDVARRMYRELRRRKVAERVRRMECPD